LVCLHALPVLAAPFLDKKTAMMAEPTRQYFKESK